jgi:hypothetical protein
MITLHPNILEKDGKKEFAVLPIEEFIQIQNLLQDFEDLKELRWAKEKEKDIAGFSVKEAREKLKL